MKHINFVLTIMPFILIGVVALVFILLTFVAIDYYKTDKLCEDNGYDMYSISDIEVGYVQCCNEVYKYHKFKGYDCKIFKR